MNKQTGNTLLVPTDLTSVASRAIDHSLEIAKQFNLKICLLHIVAKKTTFSENKKIEEKLKAISEFCGQQANVEIIYLIREGNIFDTISHAASEISAEMVVMGVHNKRSEIDIMGSFAYNVIRSSKVPVMIVNLDNMDVSDNHIIVPVDYLKIQSKLKANIAVKYAKQFNCPVYVTGDIYYESSVVKKGTADTTKANKELFIKDIAEYIESAGVEVKTGIKMKSKTILVPTDFTPDADRALDHAIEIAKVFDRNICLMHVVGEFASNTEKEKNKSLLKTISQEKAGKSGVEISHILKEGSIFDVITSAVSELSAGFVVMGYHGKQDVKHLTKGFTYTVISGSKVPVMLVKKNNKKISDNSIIVPIDFSHEKLKKINKATKIARHFDCLIHVIGVIHTEESLQKRDKQALKKRIVTYLESEGLKYKAELLEKPKTILVPTDFTEAAGCAVNHAIQLAGLFKRKIVLLNVIGKKNPESMKMAESKMKSFMEPYKKTTDIDFSFEIKSGSIFNAITNTALEVSAEFIIMGVHGKKGLQHILGSYAYKVIKNSKVPIMVVRRKCTGSGYKNIVVSVDFSDESRIEVNTAIRFARFFDSKLHIIGVIESKSRAVKLKQEVFLNNMISHVENVGVQVNAELLIKSSSGVHDNVLQYARKVDADLLLIVAQKGGKIAEVFGNNYAERIIDKSEIPVLSVIPHYNLDEDPVDKYSVGAFIDPFGLTR